MGDRRGSADRRKLVDLTRVERGEPERRALPGIERRDLEEGDLEEGDLEPGGRDAGAGEASDRS